ncbi:MAG: hypothetical protein AB8H79_20955 [Myxococcota bacterium]
MLRSGPVALVGPAGVGTTVTAGALVQRLLLDGIVQRVAAVPIDETAGRPDMVLAIGKAIGANMPGDETSVLDALSRTPSAVLLDDADLAPGPVQTLVSLAPETRWVLTGRVAHTGQAVPVQPLSPSEMRVIGYSGDLDDLGGLPLLFLLPPTIEPGPSWASSLLASSPSLAQIIDLPSGVPATELADVSMGARLVSGRALPRRSVREALGRHAEPSGSALSRLLQSHLDALHALASDSTIHTDPMDLRGLRAATHLVEDRALRVLAAVAAARMHLHAFQASEALELVRTALSWPRLPSEAKGLLRWLEGDALLTQGSDDLAHAAHLSAAAALRVPGATSARVGLARRCADEWVVRGDRLRAQKWISLARSDLAREPDIRALADTLRINGDLAAQAGEFLGASALYDEALATLGSDPLGSRERAFIRLGKSSIATASRDFAVAEEELRMADQTTGDHPAMAAAIAWRRAEVALRRGRRAQAREALSIAEAGFRGAGSLRGLFLCARMEGDLAAVEGDRQAAIDAWLVAQQLCLRTRNIHGLRRILRRRLAVEREGLPGPHLAEIQSHFDRVEVLLGLS